MQMMSPDILPDDFTLMGEIDADMKSVIRMIVFSPSLHAATLLQRYMEAIGHLRHVLELKNAQQEAQTEQEAVEYLENLEIAMRMMVSEIASAHCIEQPVDLFRLFRTVAPDSARRHANHYRQTLVQVGGYLAPDPKQVEALVDELFWLLPQIPNPLIRAIWMHHELIRIHPFVDGNGRVARMAKNWLLMYELYPPIFIYGHADRSRYIRGLEKSFMDLEEAPETFHASTRQFFEDELRRMKASTGFLLRRIERDAATPFGEEDEEMQPYPTNRSTE